MTVFRRDALRMLGLTLAASPILSRTAQAAEPIMIGVSGPLTGQYAQYGVQWKRGFDLALDHIAPIDGRVIKYDFEDSQSDPRQAVGIAQKFVADPAVVVEVGDFSSAASMAASPIYQRGKLVQFGFTNSHPDFTKGGDYMWSNSPSQADDMPVLADYAIRQLGLKKLAVLYINSDWGRTSEEIFVKVAQGMGASVVAQEGYLPTDKDFRSTLVRVRDAGPDGISPGVLLSGRRADHPPDPQHRTQAGGGRLQFGLFAEIPRARRRRGERRLHRDDILSGRSAPGGARLRA